MYAIIETGGKQYMVQKGDVITVEKLDAKEGAKVTFDKVLVMGEGKDVEIGTPYVGSTVAAKVIENGKGEKVVIFKYKAKKDYRRKQGHRQPFTKVEITAIGKESKSTAAKPKKEATKEAAPKKAEAKAEPKKETSKAKTEAKADDKKSVSMSMKKDELIAFAKENNIKVDAKATKQVIIDTIKENM